MNITIRQISIDDVITNDKVKYNTNNHLDVTRIIMLNQ
jgi:hypothetical protein